MQLIQWRSQGFTKLVSGGIVFDSSNLKVGDNLSSPTSSLTKDGKTIILMLIPLLPLLDFMMPLVQNKLNIQYFLKNGAKWSREIFNSSGELTDTINYNYESNLLADETLFKLI